MIGTVKNVQDRGFGFILGEDNKEYFFHMSDFRGSWHNLKNDVKLNKVAVEFEVDAKNKKGPRAGNVTII